jgi:hypothetical protein
MSPAAVLRIVKAVGDRAVRERRQADAHPSDQYQKGRALATEQTLEEILKIVRER